MSVVRIETAAVGGYLLVPLRSKARLQSGDKDMDGLAGGLLTGSEGRIRTVN